MNKKNLHFFDKSGYDLNFQYIEISEEDNIGYWIGDVFLPKVSLGLYANTTIYVLEEITDDNGNKKYVFPIADDEDSRIMFSWDILNKFVDEFFMFTFDQSYIQTDTSSLEFKENDGPDCEPVLITRFDTYEIELESGEVSKAIPIHIAFTSPEKYDSNTFKRTLVMEYNFQQIARINFYAETIEEDERLKTLNYNLGYNISKSDESIFKESNIKEPKPDFNLLNQKRKELMLTGHEIYPHVGNYKALINALKFFGYNNLNIIDIWYNVNEGDENYGKYYYVKKYKLSDNEVIYLNNHKISLPNYDYRKSTNIALSYLINNPIKEYDVFELPSVEEEFNYSIEEAVIKLFQLRKKLNKEFLPGRSRIIDIVGEANYFGLCEVNHNFRIGSTSIYKSGKDLSFSAFPSQYVRLDSDKLFNEYMYQQKIDGWNSTVKNNSSIVDNINDYLLEDVNLLSTNIDKANGETIAKYTSSQDELCDYYKKYYEELNVNFTIEDNIYDDLNDYFQKRFNFTCTYYDETTNSYYTKDEDTISDPENLVILKLNSVLNTIDKDTIQTYKNFTIDENKNVLSCYKKLKKIEIAYGITSIGNNSFQYLQSIEEIIIPNTIESIGSYVFYKNGLLSNSSIIKLKYSGTKDEWKNISKNSSWNQSTYKNIIISYNEYIDLYENNSIAARIILTNDSITEKTFEETNYLFGNLNNYITFDNFDYSDYTNIEWTVTFSDDQTDEDLTNVNIDKVYDSQEYTKTKSGTIDEYNSCLFELPYVGYYDVQMSLTDKFNSVNNKILKKYIKVEPYNIDIRGFYYDARDIPESLISNEYYRNMILSDDSDELGFDLDALNDIQISTELTDEEYYYEMKEFIMDRIDSMIQIALPESASRTGEVSMPLYKAIYDSMYCIVYADIDKNVIKLDIIETDEDGNKIINDDGSYNLTTIYDETTDSKYYELLEDSDSDSEIYYYYNTPIVYTYEKNYRKFYETNNTELYKIYTKIEIDDSSDFDLESSVTYEYMEFIGNTIQYNDGLAKHYTTDNPIIDGENNLKNDDKFIRVDTVNQGPYLFDNLFEEWYLADNVNLDITTLKPQIKYIRYIKNGVDIKPYTWIMLGYDNSLIKGKCNPRWYLINTTYNKTYPNKIYADDNMDEDEINALPSHKGKYFTYLLKDEGNYTIRLELDDINGNTYSIERNLFIVADDANYKLYTPFITDYKDMLDIKDLKYLKMYNDTSV